MVRGFRSVVAGLTFLALLAAPAIGFSHAVIPHGHTHTHDSALHTAIAHGLDQALIRKDITVPMVLISVLLMIVMQELARPGATGQMYTQLHIMPLRRGILPYRRFD